MCEIKTAWSWQNDLNHIYTLIWFLWSVIWNFEMDYCDFFVSLNNLCKNCKKNSFLHIQFWYNDACDWSKAYHMATYKQVVCRVISFFLAELYFQLCLWHKVSTHTSNLLSNFFHSAIQRCYDMFCTKSYGNFLTNYIEI